MLSTPSQVQRGGDHPTAAVELAGLGNRFIGLLGRKWSRRAFAAEMAKLLADAARAKATAVLGYEHRSGALTLLADHGLTAEARAALSSGADGAWDIPLRGLQNRRISVIEAAHQNPFVPRDLTSFCPTGLSIVALPLYYDYEPVGVVLLFAARSRAFSDAQLQTLSQALRVCGRGLRDRETPAPRPIGTVASGSEGVAAVPGAPGEAPPALRLLQGAQPETSRAADTEAPVTEAQRVEQELAQAQADMRRRSEAVRNVKAATRALKSERDRLAQQLTELEYLRQSETSELRTQLSTLEERLMAIESERVRYQRAADAKRQRAEEALQAMQTERDTLVERLHALESSGTEVRTAMGALRDERDRLAALSQTLTAELQTTRSTLEAERTNRSSELKRLEAELAEARGAHSTREQELEGIISAQQSDLHELAAQAQRQLAQGAAALAARDEALATLRTQLERTGIEQQEVRQALENALAQAREHIERLTQHSTTLTAHLAQRDAELARAGDENARAHEAEAALHESTAALREEIATVTARFDQAIATAEAREHDFSRQLAEAHAEIAALRQSSEEREALARAASDLGSKAARLEQAVTTLREQAASARAQCACAEQQVAELSTQLAAAQRIHQEAQAIAEGERTQWETALEELAHEQQRLETERRQAIAEQDQQRRVLEDLQAAVEQARAERQQALQQVRQLTVETDTRQRDIEQLQQQTTERQAALANATDECIQLKDAVRTAEAAAAAAMAQAEELRQTVREAVQRLEEQRLQHAAELEALLEESASSMVDAPETGTAVSVQPEAPAIAEEEEAVERAEEPLIIERSAPLATVAENIAEAAEEPAAAGEAPRTAVSVGELVLLDQGPCGEQACAALAGAGFEVSLFAFGEATVDELARRRLKCIMLNLAAGPAAWHTLKLLRERVGTRNVPILAYVMKPESPMGFCFGRTDFALWPLESGRMIERLGRLRPKLQRLLAVTADVDGMGRLREPLARAKISTSIVLDARQVLDFASMIDPEAGILHLSPSCPSAARAILALRSNEATRELPLLVLLDKIGGADEETFFVQASRQLLGKAGFQFSRLPEEIGRLIG